MKTSDIHDSEVLTIDNPRVHSEAVGELFFQIFSEYELRGVPGFGRKMAQAIVNHSEIAFVIMRDGSPVGAVTGSMNDLPSEKFQEVPDYIGGGVGVEGIALAVHPKYRKMGIAEKLISHLMEWGKQHGGTYIWLVSDESFNTMGFYAGKYGATKLEPRNPTPLEVYVGKL